MRDFLNGILSFIGSESLTDLEFSSIGDLAYGYNQATYTALSTVLEGREAVSTMQDKLFYYFKAQGAEIEQADTGKSNIFIGSVLC